MYDTIIVGARCAAAGTARIPCVSSSSTGQWRFQPGHSAAPWQARAGVSAEGLGSQRLPGLCQPGDELGLWPAHDAATEVRDHPLEAARTQLRMSNVQAVAGGIKHAGGFMPWHMLLQHTQPYTAVRERHAERGPLGIPLRLPGGENSPTPGFRQAQALTLVEVEVDTLLGKIRPIHAWTEIAAGKIFVPALARSQVYGAVIQRLGYALYEAREVDLATGRNLTANLEAYKLPGIGDTPEIEVHFVEEGCEKVRGQGIGLSELAMVGVAAAVGNAVFHATGWRPLNTPIRAQDVIEGVRSC